MGTDRWGGRRGAWVVERRRRCPVRSGSGSGSVSGSCSGVGSGRRVGERGSATAEYAVVILAAVAFAGLLVAVMKSGAVQDLLVGIVRSALSS